MQCARWGRAAAALVVATVLGAVAPGGGAAGASAAAPDRVTDDRPYDWMWCRDRKWVPTMVLILSPYPGCSLSGAIGYTMISPSGGNTHELRICSFSRYAAFHTIVDPVGSQAPIWYNDQPGGGCYIRTLGYPIRKFRAYWDGMDSGWTPLTCSGCHAVNGPD